MKKLFRNRFHKLESNYDIVIIGGGIYGTALLWEFSSRGLSCILVECNDFASGTSRNSLKIIHGGLRSLQSLNIFKTRQYILERKYWMKIAPNFISPIKFLMPSYRSLSKNKIVLSIGLLIYSILSIDRNLMMRNSKSIPRPSILSKRKLFELMPGYSGNKISGGITWYDAQVNNTERLVISFINSAKKLRCPALNYCQVNSLIEDGDKVKGVVISDKCSGDEVKIDCDLVVDCSGPWNAVKKLFDSERYLKEINHSYSRAQNIVLKKKISDIGFGFKSTIRGEGINNSRLLFY